MEEFQYTKKNVALITNNKNRRNTHTSIALFIIPNPNDGLMEKADIIQCTGLAGTGILNMYLPCGPILTSFHNHTFSY